MAANADVKLSVDAVIGPGMRAIDDDGENEVTNPADPRDTDEEFGDDDSEVESIDDDKLDGQADESGPDDDGEERSEDDERHESQEGREGEPDPDRVKELADKLGLDPDKDKDLLAKIALEVQPSESAPGKGDDADTSETLAEIIKAEGLGDENPAALKDGEAAKPGEGAAGSGQRDDEPVRFGDIGDSWNSLEDGFKALDEAYKDDGEGGLKRVTDVHNALFNRMMFSRVPLISKVAEHRAREIIKAELGDLMPEFQRAKQVRVHREASSKAEKLMAEKLGEPFESMFKDDGGPEIKVGGKVYEKIPYNRILIKHPWINDIRKDHKDPAKAALLTFLARYDAAFRVHRESRRNQQNRAKDAAELVEAGKNAGKRSRKDDIRQRLNSGSKTHGKIQRGGSAQDEDEEMKALLRASSGSSLDLLD